MNDSLDAVGPMGRLAARELPLRTYVLVRFLLATVLAFVITGAFPDAWDSAAFLFLLVLTTAFMGVATPYLDACADARLASDDDKAEKAFAKRHMLERDVTLLAGTCCALIATVGVDRWGWPLWTDDAGLVLWVVVVAGGSAVRARAIRDHGLPLGVGLPLYVLSAAGLAGVLATVVVGTLRALAAA